MAVRSGFADHPVEGAQANGATVQANPLVVGGVDGSGNARQFLTDTTGVLQVGVAAGASDRTATGNITSNQTVSINTQGGSIVRAIVTGTWTGTLIFKIIAADGTTALAESVYPFAPGGAAVSSATANGQWDLVIAGHQQFQVIGSTVGSGTAVVSLEVTDAPGVVGVRQVTAANLNAQVVGNVASGAADSGNGIKAASKYNASPPTFTDGQRADLQADSAGNLKETLATLLAGEDLTNNVLTTTHKAVVASTYSPSSYQSATSGALVVSANIKNAAGNLLGVCAVNLNAATRYLWITNAAAAPANALASSDATVLFMIAMPTLSTLILPTGFFTVPGKNFGTGISYGFSTSATSYTAGTATDHTLNATYV